MVNSPKKQRKETEVSNVPLPPSGLAEDVLGAESPDRREQTTKAVVPASPTPEGPDRLFAFADSLRRLRDNDGNGEKPEEHLETWVTFMLQGEYFGLPVTHVLEILRVTSITRVPHAPRPVRGVTNMRGKVLPVVDLRLRLGLVDSALTEHNRILVVSAHKHLMGLLVDSVQQVVRISPGKIQPPPPDVMTEKSDYIQGVYHLQESIVILLDVERMLIIRDSLQSENSAVDRPSRDHIAAEPEERRFV